MIPEIVIVVRDGRVDSVLSSTPAVDVSILDFDTDDLVQAEENEAAGRELQKRIENLELVSVV